MSRNSFGSIGATKTLAVWPKNAGRLYISLMAAMPQHRNNSDLDDSDTVRCHHSHAAAAAAHARRYSIGSDSSKVIGRPLAGLQLFRPTTMTLSYIVVCMSVRHYVVVNFLHFAVIRARWTQTLKIRTALGHQVENYLAESIDGALNLCI